MASQVSYLCYFKVYSITLHVYEAPIPTMHLHLGILLIGIQHQAFNKYHNTVHIFHLKKSV